MRRLSRGLVGVAILAMIGLGSLMAERSISAPPPSPYLVIMVADGFRPDYMNLAPMPHLQSLMASGMTYGRAWVGQLASETPTGHATIATGVYPKKHGVIDFGWRDVASQSFTWMPTNLIQLNAGDMERLIEGGGAPTISDEIHQAYPGSTVAALSGEKYYAADALGTGADYILFGKASSVTVAGKTRYTITVTPIGNHVPPPATHYQASDMKQPPYPWVQDDFAAQLATRLVRTVQPRALLINFPGPDIEGHVSGGITEPNNVRPVVQGLDRDIGEVVAAYKKAGLLDRTIFVFTADHGMVPNTHIAPKHKIYAAVASTGAPTIETEAAATTSGYVYLRNNADAPRVASALLDADLPHTDGVFYKVGTSGGWGHFVPAGDTAAKLGPALTQAYTDLCNTLAGPTGPDVVVPYTEDTLGIVVKGYGPHWGWHGGLTWGVQHIPMVISGPGVRHGTSSFPAQLVDVAPTVERLMGIDPPKAVDGVVLADALQSPTSTETDTQAAVEKRRSEDVDALILRSHQEHGLYLTKKLYR